MSESRDSTSMTQRGHGLVAAGLVATGLFIAGALVAAYHRGIWLDELWSIFEGQHDLALGAIVRDRWMAEISPPLFYALSWLMTPLVGDDIFLRRAFNLVPLMVAACALIWLARRNPGRRAFVALLALLLMAHPASIAQFAEHRGYFTMLAGSAVLAATLAIWLASERDEPFQRLIVGFSFASALVIFSLHYIVAFQIAVIAGIVIVAQFALGRRRQAILVALALVAAGLPSVATFLVQRQALVSFAQTGWIRFEWSSGAVIVGAVLVTTVVTCAVALAAILMRRHTWVGHHRTVRAAIVLAGAAAASLGALLALHAVQPIIVERYLEPCIPFLIAPVALLAARALTVDRVLAIATVAVALLSIALNARKTAGEERWDGAARIVAAQKRQCPTTIVHAIPHWRFTERPLIVSEQEVVVMRLGRSMEARKFGLRIEPETSRRLSADCPTIVWVSHWHNPPVSLARLADRSTLPLDPSQVRGAKLHDSGPWLVAVFPPRR